MNTVVSHVSSYLIMSITTRSKVRVKYSSYSFFKVMILK
jgi:hypothetical protein